MKRAAVLVCAAIAAAACGSGGGSSPTTPTAAPTPAPQAARSALSVTVTPNPVIATPSTDASFPWVASFTVAVRETAGLACNMNRVNATIVGGASAIEWGVNEIQSRTTGRTNYIAANGSLDIPNIGFTYRGAFGARSLAFTVIVEAIDARGATVTASTSVQALREGEPARMP